MVNVKWYAAGNKTIKVVTTQTVYYTDKYDEDSNSVTELASKCLNNEIHWIKVVGDGVYNIMYHQTGFFNIHTDKKGIPFHPHSNPESLTGDYLLRISRDVNYIKMGWQNNSEYRLMSVDLNTGITTVTEGF